VSAGIKIRIKKTSFTNVTSGLLEAEIKSEVGKKFEKR